MQSLLVQSFHSWHSVSLLRPNRLLGCRALSSLHHCHHALFCFAEACMRVVVADAGRDQTLISNVARTLAMLQVGGASRKSELFLLHQFVYH